MIFDAYGSDATCQEQRDADDWCARYQPGDKYAACVKMTYWPFTCTPITKRPWERQSIIDDLGSDYPAALLAARALPTGSTGDNRLAAQVEKEARDRAAQAARQALLEAQARAEAELRARAQGGGAAGGTGTPQNTGGGAQPWPGGGPGSLLAQLPKDNTMLYLGGAALAALAIFKFKRK